MQITNIVKTMSSREIAALTGKAHPKVTADIEKMLCELGEDTAAFRRIYLDSMNREQTEYLLDRELTETLLTGYSAKLRRAVVARWRELESQVAITALPDFSNPVAAARAWADAVELQQSSAKQLAIAAPKAEALDRLTLAEGAMCITNAAKSLGMQPKRLFSWMQANDWIYRRTGSAAFIAYQARIKTGVLDHKITTVGRSDGSEKVVAQVLVTAKGLIALAGVAA